MRVIVEQKMYSQCARMHVYVNICIYTCMYIYLYIYVSVCTDMHAS